MPGTRAFGRPEHKPCLPGIHAFIQNRIIKDVDGRDKPGHDSVGKFNANACQPKPIPLKALLIHEP
jgi:hypothetical protein